MSHEQFKAFLQRDKMFLKELYVSDSKAKTRKILNFGSDSEINTLSKYIHFVCNGEIHIKKQNFDSLEKHLRFIKKVFEKKPALQKFNQLQRREKLKQFYRLQNLFSDLLAPLFNE